MAFLLRTPTTQTEERTLGLRAVLLLLPGGSETTLKAAVQQGLNLFDQSAGTSPTEQARGIIVALRRELGESAQICMVGMLQREAWIATTGKIGVAALVMRETRRSTISLPDSAPGAGEPSSTRQGVTVGRLPVSEGDRIAIAPTSKQALELLKFKGSGETEIDQPKALLSLLPLVVAATRGGGGAIREPYALPADNIAAASARARVRWEEGNLERNEQIAATVAPKPTGEPRRRVAETEPYTPIDRAAQEVIASRRGEGARENTPVRGANTTLPQPINQRRARDTARSAAKARAERAPGTEPYIERSWAERATSAPSPIQRATARFMARLEERLPWLANREAEPTLHANREARRRTPEEAAARSRRIAASLLLSAMLIAGVGGVAAIYLNQADPNLDAAAKARSAMSDARLAVEEALNPATNLLINDPDRARKLLVSAAESLKAAEIGGVPATEISSLQAQMEPALNKLFFLTKATVMEVFDFASASAPIKITAITQGPDGYSYIVDDYSGAVYRVDPAAEPNPRATVVYQPGYDLYGSRTGRAQTIASCGPDLLILDTSSNLWRWRPAGGGGTGTLVKLRVRDGELWGNDVKIISGFAADDGTGLYRLYVIDPSARQILRYTPAPDGTGYPAPPTGYLINPAPLASVTAMAIDGDLYLAQNGEIHRYSSGALDDWAPADPGDSVLRSAPEISAIFSAGASKTGVIYAWDTKNQRMLAYSKGGSGNVLAQYELISEEGPIGDIVGGYIALAADGGAPTFVWAEGTRIRSAVLGTGITPGGGGVLLPTAAPVIELPSVQP